MNQDATNDDDWVTVNGQHIEVNENGEVIKGNPKAMGQESKSNEKSLNNPENSGTIYAGKQIQRYAENPKELGETTHKEKYDDFKEKGVDVQPLTQSKTLKNVPYEEGGGYKVNDGKDGVLTYHPAKGSHHGGEYYKVGTGKTGKKRYDMEGNPIY
jgi:hypothetical protein